MRVGIVCPYSWDVPGGVQGHVRDLAECLIGMGHEVSVLAPVEEPEAPGLPPYLVPAGRSVPGRETVWLLTGFSLVPGERPSGAARCCRG